jgi:hypothetical protein
MDADDPIIGCPDDELSQHNFRVIQWMDQEQARREQMSKKKQKPKPEDPSDFVPSK